MPEGPRRKYLKTRWKNSHPSSEAKSTTIPETTAVGKLFSNPTAKMSPRAKSKGRSMVLWTICTPWVKRSTKKARILKLLSRRIRRPSRLRLNAKLLA